LDARAVSSRIFAAEGDFAQSTVAAWRSGRRLPNESSVRRLAQVLDIERSSLDELIDASRKGYYETSGAADRGPRADDGDTIVEATTAEAFATINPPTVRTGEEEALSVARPVVPDGTQRERIVGHAGALLRILPELLPRVRELGLDDHGYAILEQTIDALRDLLEIVEVSSPSLEQSATAPGLIRRALGLTGRGWGTVATAVSIALVGGTATGVSSTLASSLINDDVVPVVVQVERLAMEADGLCVELSDLLELS
jgi:transcriptional regulator with XRE-family HTH domain